MIRGPRRGAVSAGVALAVVLLAAQPAAADPPRPTDYRSVIQSVEPVPDGVEVRIVGGDAFLELQVEDGHEVTVAGYQGEPYLQFGRDGTVERNRRSPATYVNDSRNGRGDVPDEASEDAEPRWETVAQSGTYAWHDHRIHWMQPGRPSGLSPGDVVQQWTVDLTVDGTPTSVTGQLIWVRPVNPLPWAMLGTAVAAVVAAGGLAWWPRHRGPLAAAAAVVAALVALVVGWGQYGVAPAGSGVSPLLVAIPFAGVVAGLAGVLLRHRGRLAAAAATLAAVSAVLGWGLLRLAVLWKPVIPTDLPAGIDRAGTASALGLAAAAALLVVLAGGLAPIPAERRPLDQPPLDERS